MDNESTEEKTKSNDDSGINENEVRPSKESIRKRSRHSRTLRHPRDCCCGRPRLLLRKGCRWRRLDTCHRCTYLAPTPKEPGCPSSGKGGRHE